MGTTLSHLSLQSQKRYRPRSRLFLLFNRTVQLFFHREYSGPFPVHRRALSGTFDRVRWSLYNLCMAENENAPPPEREDIDIRTEPERVADDKVEALERELAALQPGVQVVIERLKPTWCKGQLEKLTVDDDGLDLDYLIQNWGGQLLSIKIIGAGGRIRGSHSVELYSFEPRRYGKLLRAPNKPDEEETTAPAQNPVVVHPPAQDASLMGKMFDMLNAQRASEVETLRLLLTQQQLTSAPAPAQTFNGVGELLKLAGAFNKLKDMFQSEQPQAMGNPDDMFPMQMMDMLGKFIDNRQQPRGQLVPPQQPQGQPSQGPPLPAAAAKVTTPTRQGHPGGEDMIAQFQTLPPEKAADVLMTALGRMPPEKQQAAFDVMKDRFYKFMPEIFDLMNEAAADEEETEGVGES